MKFYFHTFGCRVNQYETCKVLREKLVADGASAAVPDFEDADVCVINTCTVTQEADREALKLVRRISAETPPRVWW